MESKNWPLQLKELIPKSAYGANSIMYAIALEGWKRGLTLKFHKSYVNNKVRIRYSLANQDREHKFNLSLGDTVPKESKRIAKSKEKTKEFLMKANVPTPKGRNIGLDMSEEEIIRYSKTLGYPLVVKPTNSSLGKGVTTNITDEHKLIECIRHVREELGYSDLILEQQATGMDTRVFVVGDQVVSAYKRIPANVIGDGENTIADLIEMKNILRSKNPHACGYQINIDDEMISFLAKSEYKLESIPEKGKRIFLTESTLHALAAETVDITDELSEESKLVAINAAKSIPGMAVCGVDIMIDNDKGTNYVLELNSRPNIGGGLFPLEGQGRDIPKAIVDHFFPETIGRDTTQYNQLYFNYFNVSNILYNGIAEEVIVPPIPNGNFLAKKIIVRKRDSKLIFSNLIYKKALGLQLSGYVKKLSTNQVMIVAAGEESNVNELIELVKERSKTPIEVDDWEENIRIGYRLIKPRLKKVKKKVETGTNNKTKENQLMLERDKAIEKLNKMENSKSWRYTTPLRKIVKKINRG